MTETVSPHTAADALKAWDAGTPLRAFRVNSDGASQDKIYAAAFDILRRWDPERQTMPGDYPHLSRREFDSAFSIAFVARERGWARMVQEHIHQAAPEITVRRARTGNAG